ncbi:MAG: LexA family protein [Alphaproteobacteria bacterium]|nr:S24 family peptidase [Alphaproteobacteria bacterium]
MLSRSFLKHTDKPSVLALPLVLSSVRAGFPSMVEGELEGALDLHDLLITHPAATFYVRVEGDSMVGAGIFPGDMVIVDRALEARNGDLIIAVLDGELTLKRFIKQKNQVCLRAENPDYPDIQIPPNKDFMIWGVVSGCVKKFR